MCEVGLRNKCRCHSAEDEQWNSELPALGSAPLAVRFIFIYLLQQAVRISARILWTVGSQSDSFCDSGQGWGAWPQGCPGH